MSASIEPEVDSVVPLLKKRTGATGAHAFSRFAFALLLPALLACENTDEATSTVPAAISLTSELGGSADGYERACAPRDFVFPDDHGAHPGYRNEWWYVTGNLNNEDGRKFGFHATFFRIANQPPAVDGVLVTTGNPQAPANAWLSSSEWAATQFYMGHFAISEEGTKKSLAHERFARAAAGLAGAAAKPVRVWLDDWQLLGPTLLDERYRHEDDRPHEVAQEGTQL